MKVCIFNLVKEIPHDYLHTAEDIQHLTGIYTVFSTGQPAGKLVAGEKSSVI